MNILIIVLIVFFAGCNAESTDHVSLIDYPRVTEPKKKPPEIPLILESAESFIERESAQIQRHWKELQRMGHAMGETHWMLPFLVLGKYGWRKTEKELFGAYTFSPLAFEQAKDNWWIYGKITKGTSTLKSLTQNIRFDESIIGHRVGAVYMRKSEKFFSGAVVVGIVDSQTVLLDRIAENDGEMYGLSILSPQYVDMCNCHLDYSSTSDSGWVKLSESYEE